ncbi:protein NYNRIN-like [Grus japonensis]|uniref:ribonuclease H n=1 Tax=Grus japonensis TaxID=30415 RepID=A0ABC9YHD6_GRUJA
MQLTWTVLPQGFKNSPTIFGNQLAKELEMWKKQNQGQGILLQYVDDILIAAESKGTCFEMTISLLNFLAQGGYRVSRNKAQIGKEAVIYLGFEISQGQRQSGNKRKEAICQIPEPNSPKELRAFLGIIGWCRLWILNYGLYVKPLYEALNESKGQYLTWTPECHKSFKELKRALMMAPALGLPDLTKPFELFVHKRQHLALGVLAQRLGSWKRPVGYFSKQLDTVVLLEQDDVELKTTAIVNPAMFLTTENPTEKLEHDCLLTIEQVYSTRPDLKDEPLKDPDLELFTDGSSFVQEGRRIAGYTVVTTVKILESGTLPANTSAQKAELVALKQALRMAEGKRVNIWMDSKYAFGVIHAHGAIWKERGLLSAQGSPTRHKEEVLQLLQDVQKPKEVALMHCKAHQFGQTAVNVGNQLADEAAKEAAEQGILALVPVKQMKIPNLKARYSKLDEQLAEHLKASQTTEGWWVTPENQVTWKKNDFKWGPEQRQAFEQIKQEIVHAVALGPVQAGPDVKNVLYTAAGENGPTWSLWQKAPGETRGRPLGFWSQGYRRSEACYALPKKEILAAYEGVRAASEVIGILEVITDWPEGKDFRMSPEEEVTCSEEVPLYNKLTEDEKPYALFTDGSCRIVGKHRRWKAAVWSPTRQVAEAAEGQGESSQFAEVKAMQLALDIAE